MPARTCVNSAEWFGPTRCVKIKLSAITQRAICDRANSDFNGGTSPRNSRGSVDPTNALGAGAGVGNSIAAESSSGKLRLNAIETFVGTGRNSATVTAAVQTYSCHSVKGCGSENTCQTR